jgi:hypothetical protein
VVIDVTTRISLIIAKSPPNLGKVYTLLPDGRLDKKSVGYISKGVAHTRDAPDGAALKVLLDIVTERTDTAVCPAVWQGNESGAPLDYLSAKRLAPALGMGEDDPRLGGIHLVRGRRTCARLKRGQLPSKWVLIDADDPPGMPDWMQRLTLAQRLEALEPCIAGISTCERVELRGSSARVRREDDPAHGPTHALLRISDAAKTDVLRHHLTVATQAHRLAFLSTTKSGAAAMRTVIDTSVFVVGRLIFCSKPDVSAAPGYVVDDANVTIVNESRGVLDVAGVELPDAKALRHYRESTSERLRFNGFAATSQGLLTHDTPITSRGITNPLKVWLADMMPGQSLRCEAPLRDSHSEAAVLRRTETGGFVYDSGTATTYMLPRPGDTQAHGTEGPVVVVAVGNGATLKAMAQRGIGYGLAAASAEGLAEVFVPKIARRVDIMLCHIDEIGPGQVLRDKLLKFRFRVTVWRSKGLRATAENSRDYIRPGIRPSSPAPNEAPPHTPHSETNHD